MTEVTEGGCPRCGAVNRLSRKTCWACETPFLNTNPVPAQGTQGSDGTRTLVWILAAGMGITMLIPMLAVVTCFGAAEFSR